jgi:N-acetylneuraminate synthase
VIAEMKPNHEGSLSGKMVNAALEQTVVKTQTHIVADEMGKRHLKKVIQSNATVSIYEIMERYSLNLDELELKIMQKVKE